MKRKFLMAGLMLVLSILSLRGMAQETTNDRPIPAWVSEKGYWQVVSNVKDPENFTVYFFTNEGMLVYQEKVEGVKLNLKKRKTLMRLKRALEQSVVAWENHRMQKPFVAKRGHLDDKWAADAEIRHK